MNGKIGMYIVDAFTDKPFSGNPAGVCLPERELSVQKMQSIAMELGLSETAFVQKITAPDKYSIRYFSPKMEIPLCGHATLAASKVLFDKTGSINTLHFVNIQQIDLRIRRAGESIKMEFPAYETKPATAPKAMLKALGLKKIENVAYNEETNILLIHISDSEELNALQPDFVSLIHAHQSIYGVVVTAPSHKKGFDFESRYFWPWSGTNEDPVTGATHTFLAKYWSKRLGKGTLMSFQCSKRSGYMKVELVDAHNLIIESKANIVLEGELRI